MKDKLKLISPIPPSINHYLVWRAIIKNSRPIVVSAQTEQAKEYKKIFKEYIEKQVYMQRWGHGVDCTHHFYVDVDFYFDRQRKDPNNYFKCSLDAITETQLVWKDDSLVCEKVNRILYDPINPRMEMTIYPADYIGIFDNKKTLNTFEEKCKTCNRYSRNCSILKNAKIGIIQKEIVDYKCEKYKIIKNLQNKGVK